MQQSHTVGRKLFFGNLLGILHGGDKLALVFLNKRTDYVSLKSAVKVLFNKGVYAFTV